MGAQGKMGREGLPGWSGDTGPAGPPGKLEKVEAKASLLSYEDELASAISQAAKWSWRRRRSADIGVEKQGTEAEHNDGTIEKMSSTRDLITSLVERGSQRKLVEDHKQWEKEEKTWEIEEERRLFPSSAKK
jgi:hypothetical protein